MQDNGKGELYKRKLEFLKSSEEVRKSFYSKALGDNKIMEALESLSKTMSKNPVESAFYSIDIKTFLKCNKPLVKIIFFLSPPLKFTPPSSIT